MTEIDWDSSPPDPLGIPLDLQARYLSFSFYELWRAGVSHVFWYEVRDPSAPAKSFTGGGLFFSGGQAKPSAAAFGFPFVAQRGHRTVTLWGHTPVAGRVTIELLRQNAWRRVALLKPTAGGIFYARRRLARHVTLRARAGSIASYPWTTG